MKSRRSPGTKPPGKIPAEGSLVVGKNSRRVVLQGQREVTGDDIFVFACFDEEIEPIVGAEVREEGPGALGHVGDLVALAIEEIESAEAESAELESAAGHRGA